MRTIYCWLLPLFATCVFANYLDGFPHRVYDVSGTPIQKIIVKAHHNQSLPCPGANERTLVNTLEWYSLTHHKVILDYSDGFLTVHKEPNRITLGKDYGLIVHPALSVDTGDYICLINNRLQPNGVVQLRVLDVPDAPGRPLIVSFTSRTTEISWASPQNTHFSDVKYYIINTR